MPTSCLDRTVGAAAWRRPAAADPAPIRHSRTAPGLADPLRYRALGGVVDGADGQMLAQEPRHDRKSWIWAGKCSHNGRHSPTREPRGAVMRVIETP